MESNLIEQLLAEAIEHTPRNEAQVCQCLIVPILEALGYRKWDILPQGSDSNGQYPDYTILPNTEHTWYLEAKGWHVHLDDRYAIQALNYANHNGRRWVVLTNGQDWRLYDNHIHEQADGKMVVEASIAQLGALTSLLQALSPESVQRGLDRFATVARLQLYLAGEIEREHSELVRGVLRIVRRQPGLERATAADVVRVLTSARSSNGEPVAGLPDSETGPPPPEPAASPSKDASPPSSAGAVSLGDLAAHSGQATGAKPTAVSYPDGTVESVTSWADLAQNIVSWLATRNLRPALPFHASSTATRTKRAFLNTEPAHPDGARMKGHRTVEAAGGPIFIDTNRSASLMLTSLVALCHAVGQSTATIQVSVSGRRP